MQRLKDKVAIVTGGGGGIGAATARRLVQEGARVVVADIDVERAAQVASALGDAACAVCYDAADAASIEALVGQAVERYGQLHILHNNAALTDPAVQAHDTTATDIPLDIWNAILNVNLTGYLVACRFAIPHMVRAGGGSIINTVSNSGLVGDTARIAYGTSKAGAMALTRSIATQYGRDGVRCNAISPGVILTPALEAAVPAIRANAMRHVLTRRLGTPDDVAALVAYLASEEAGYMTGQCISLDGGRLAHQPHYADFLPAT
jgi:NAD(P)-dependent dehydrogenase (short-subunit alcohol dehydrogenase family)